jgi:hypothetical protein
MKNGLINDVVVVVTELFFFVFNIAVGGQREAAVFIF